MRWSRRVCVCLLLVGLWTISLFTLAYPASVQAQGSTHTVASGETLSQIARQYGTDVATLLELNGLSNANVVYVGQKLIVTGSSHQQPSGGQSSNVQERSNSSSWDATALQNDANYQRPGRSYEPSGNYEPSAQPYQRAGTSYEPSRSNGGSDTPGQSWQPEVERSSPYVAAGTSWEPQAQTNQQRSPYLSDWESVHSGGSVYNPGQSWEPPQTPRVSTQAQLTGEKWIDVNLSDQLLIAYQGDTPVRYFTISSGSARYPTVTGSFRTYARLDKQDMSGGSQAAGDYYYVPDVPWVQYFFEGYALHGAYWHNNFGTPTGHGCVNMRVEDSRWLYDWTGVTGIRVEVHY